MDLVVVHCQRMPERRIIDSASCTSMWPFFRLPHRRTERLRWGDCAMVLFKQIVIAAGDGEKEALGAFDYLIRTTAPG